MAAQADLIAIAFVNAINGAFHATPKLLLPGHSDPPCLFYKEEAVMIVPLSKLKQIKASSGYTKIASMRQPISARLQEHGCPTGVCASFIKQKGTRLWSRPIRHLGMEQDQVRKPALTP
jgi:hypothetical protein